MKPNRDYDPWSLLEVMSAIRNKNLYPDNVTGYGDALDRLTRAEMRDTDEVGYACLCDMDRRAWETMAELMERQGGASLTELREASGVGKQSLEFILGKMVSSYRVEVVQITKRKQQKRYIIDA